MNAIAEILESCIHSSIKGETNEFQWDHFFKKWFRDYGTPCFFLFKKHLGVTNAQYAELFSLLETHCYDTYTGVRKSHFLFHTTKQIREAIVNSLNSILDSTEEEKNSAIKNFSIEYAEVLSSTVTIDLFYCSTAIALPPGVKINLNQICADSGYIHSAGRSIFIRNIKKARIYDFHDNLKQHLDKMDNNQLPVPFVVYAHEDFSGFDSIAKDQISRGIESTKLYLEKMSMGAHRLASIVEDMRNDWSDKLDIPTAGSYEEMHNFNSEKTLWLIGERSLSMTNPTNPGRERFYICYEQSIKNENPFFIFDENKPAWKSHTTLPHSLTAALINITRPLPKKSVICDPFGGTGTTWLEAKRLDLPATIKTSDLSTIAPLMVSDNLSFFLSDIAGLTELKEEFSQIREIIRKQSREPEYLDKQSSFEFDGEIETLSPEKPFLIAKQLLDQLIKDQPYEDQEFWYSDEFVKQLSSLDIISRYMFYVALRAKFRYQGGYTRRSMNFKKAFIKSLDELISQIEQFIKARKTIESSISGVGVDNYSTFQGVYSKEVISSFFLASEEKFAGDIKLSVLSKDARKLEKNSIDVIICDPPYGFNTTEDQGGLTTLYSEFIGSAINALKSNGHLIICLPAESYTGRDLPYCTRSDLIISQVLVKAEAYARQVYLPAKCLPIKELAPPYYWEAERALRRTILYFRVA